MLVVKWALGLLIAASLVVGVAGTLTAYTPRLSLADERLVGLELNAPLAVVREGAAVTLAKKGEVLTAERLGELRAAGVRRARVKEFALDRWTGAVWFAAGLLGLVVAAVGVRAMRRPAASGAAAGGFSYSEALARMEAEVTALKEIGSGEGWLRAVLDRIAAVQRDDVPAVIRARAELTAKLGLAGYAQFMDLFAAGERAVNRAWSAAADGHEAEARESLARAEGLLKGARERVGAGK